MKALLEGPAEPRQGGEEAGGEGVGFRKGKRTLSGERLDLVVLGREEGLKESMVLVGA